MNTLMGFSAPNLLVVCVDAKRADDMSGRFYSRFETVGTGFRSSFDLVAKMDEFFDKINFPQASTQKRSFFGGVPGAAGRRPNEVQKVDDMMENKGDLATFIVHVQYRQNATWQGKIVWADKKKECSFRSALEMLKLMDEAIGDDSGTESTETDQ